MNNTKTEKRGKANTLLSDTMTARDLYYLKTQHKMKSNHQYKLYNNNYKLNTSSSHVYPDNNLNIT